MACFQTRNTAIPGCAARGHPACGTSASAGWKPAGRTGWKPVFRRAPSLQTHPRASGSEYRIALSPRERFLTCSPVDYSGPPTSEELLAALQPVCASTRVSLHPLVSIQREANDYASSYPSEILACQFADGSARRLFLKYMATVEEGHRDHGFRGGLAYEGRVYSELLRDVMRPAFHGLHTGRDGTLWLILEFLDDAVRLQHAEDESAFLQAAAWLGKFHAVQEQRLAAARPAGIRVHDAEFCRGWARRTNEFAGDWHRRAPWLAGVCADFDKVIATLLAAPPTLVHGEFYPHNILYREDAIFAVDWESAAIGAGELDLAALSEGWPEDAETECQRTYAVARWPAGAPPSFAKRCAAARVFMQLRWLGEHPGWTQREEEAQWRLAELKRWAERFGVAP